MDRCITPSRDYYLSIGDIGTSDIVIPDGTHIAEGRFRVERLLARGSKADVYLAVDAWRDGHVALKIFQRIAAADRLEEFTCELKVMSGIDSEHILQTYDAHSFSLNGRKLFVIVMEYADGGTLRDWLKHYLHDPEHRRKAGLSLFRQLCKGVAKLHDNGIIHRDIKPENTLFCGAKPKLADFGYSSIVSSCQVHGPRGGTPEYMAPEQLMENLVIDSTADIYALGSVLYEILHARCALPFSGKFDYLKAIKPHHLPARIDGIHDDLWKVILTCMQIDPTKRYRNGSELLEALDMISSHKPETSDFWAVICQHIETGDLVCAHNNCRQFAKSNPNHMDALNILQQLDYRYQQAADMHNSINRDLLNSSFNVLWSMFEQAEQLYPGHPEVRATLTALNLRIQEYGVLFKEGIRHISEKNWNLALVCFQRARSQFPGQIKASELEQSILSCKDYEANSIRRINRLMEQRDFETALEIAKEFDRYTQDVQDKAGEICSESNQ